MAEEIMVAGDLQRLFGEYPRIGDLIYRLGSEVDQIVTLNSTAGGQSDDVAKQYKSKADPGGRTLQDLVTLLKSITDQTGQSGEDAMKIFTRAEDGAKQLANDWKSSGG